MTSLTVNKAVNDNFKTKYVLALLTCGLCRVKSLEAQYWNMPREALYWNMLWKHLIQRCYGRTILNCATEAPYWIVILKHRTELCYWSTVLNCPMEAPYWKVLWKNRTELCYWSTVLKPVWNWSCLFSFFPDRDLTEMWSEARLLTIDAFVQNIFFTFYISLPFPLLDPSLFSLVVQLIQIYETWLESQKSWKLLPSPKILEKA